MPTPMLIPCRTCGRHVHAGEPRCPFCEAPSPCDGRVADAVVPDPSVRLGRAALFVFGASLTVASAPGCNTLERMLHHGRGGSGNSQEQTETIAAPYGAPPQILVEAGGPPDDATAGFAPVPHPLPEHAGIQTHYGGPPMHHWSRAEQDALRQLDPVAPPAGGGTDPSRHRRGR